MRQIAASGTFQTNASLLILADFHDVVPGCGYKSWRQSEHASHVRTSLGFSDGSSLKLLTLPVALV